MAEEKPYADWLAMDETQELRGAVVVALKKGHEKLRGLENFNEYCKQDGYLEGLEAVLNILTEMEEA